MPLPVPACRCGYLPCTADPDAALEALWQHIEEAHGDSVRCGECGGALTDHACVDCGTRHGAAKSTVYPDEHVFILGHDFIDDTYNAECSCGWESQEAHPESADAMDDWDNHCDVVFMEAT